VGHSPQEQPLPNGIAWAPSLLPALPASELREGREGGCSVVYWTRQTGRQKSKWERTERQFSKSTTEGEGALPLLTCLQRVPSSPFLMYPVLPCWLPGSMLLQTPKEELRNQKISPVCPQKRCCGPRGRHRMGSVDRKQRKGVQEEAFGLGVGGKQCISHLRNPLFPLSKHRAQYLEKKKKREREREKVFWLLGRCRPPSSQAQVGRWARACTCKR